MSSISIKKQSYKLINYLIVFTSIILPSCSSHDKGEYMSLDIPVAINNKTEIKLSEISESVKWIKLSSDAAPFVGIVDKIIEADNNLVILGKEGVGNKSMIYIFNMEGKYIRTIGEFGKGPCEYIQISDMFFDSARKKILVLGESNKYIVEYDLDGVCKETTVETHGAMNFITHNGNCFLHRSSNGMYYDGNNSFNQIVVSNLTNSISNEIHPSPHIKSTYLNPFIEECVFINIKDQLLYFIPLDDTVYKLTASFEKPYIIFNHGSQSFPNDYKWDLEGRQKARNLKMSKITDIMYSGGLFFFSYRYQSETGILMYNDNKLVNCYSNNEPGFVDDIDGLENVSDFFVCGDHIMQVFEPYKLMDVKPNKYGFSKDVSELISGLNENNSVVLRRIKVKREVANTK